jgi:2,3-bisphosphoglycerate-independent phosphoglycerate mutase
MQASVPVLAKNAGNAARGDAAATHLWLWGQGQRPALTDFKTRFGITGAMTTSVDLLRGLAALLGWTNLDVPGCTGYLDNDYAGQAAAAANALETVDLVVVHVEACDEVSHEGNAAAKVAVLERIDAEIVGPLHAKLKTMGDYRILVSPDHPTFVRTKTHSHGPVPFAMCGTGVQPDSASEYHEVSAASSSLMFTRGCELMPYFLEPA